MTATTCGPPYGTAAAGDRRAAAHGSAADLHHPPAGLDGLLHDRIDPDVVAEVVMEDRDALLDFPFVSDGRPGCVMAVPDDAGAPARIISEA